ncbi:MAG: heme lyase CcmF/NrfE family subunit [Deltaproteobacteria bacterium]|nr:heme lyase CcmF/NrfE family subunit [Deltaproteobacteria bacterium]
MSPIVTIGNLCIGLSIGLCLFGILSFIGARKSGSETAASLGRGSLYGNFILMTVANLAMIYALLSNDFGVSYVSHVGSLETPRWISAISLWSSLEGSILFWGWILATYTASCLYLYKDRKEGLLLWAGLVFLVIELFFFILLALPANPFLPVQPTPANGPGPNPLLQNHWLMAIHPPCLYLGYIGFTVPFAFAVATLLEGPSGGWRGSGARPRATGEHGWAEPEPGPPATWTLLTRPWLLFAWSFQTIAIVLGGWWSYAVLGWGGYWAWDPVENASFMPWLAGTALVHSVMVQEKRKMLPVWNLMLAILTFLLTLLGTFLTRSGVLDSVHSFTESHIGPYFLVFIGIVLSASLALLLWKSQNLRQPGQFESFLSLEFLFLFNNLLFLSFCFVVFLGTWYPLLVEAIRGTRISVGEPYFNQMTVPIVLLITLLMSLGLVTPWKRGNFKNILSASRFPLFLSLGITLILLIVGIRNWAILLLVLLASLALDIMIIEVLRISWKRAEGNILKFIPAKLSLLNDNPRRYGGFIAHIGALILIVAVAISSIYDQEKEITLKPDETTEVGGYQLTLKEIRGDEVPQRFEIKAVVNVSRDGKSLETLTPQMNFYPTSREPIGSPAIRSTLIEDLYLTLNNFEKDGSQATLKVIITPAVIWIWIGGGITMLGGLLAMVCGRKREL